MHLQENILFDFDLGVGSRSFETVVAQYPLYHVTYALAKFEFAASNGLGGNALTRKYII